MSDNVASMDIARRVQIAMLGEVPHTLRFLYVSLTDNILNFHAVFTDDATDDHLESASCVLTEIIASCPHNVALNEMIERDSNKPWKIGDSDNLMYLRYGELSHAQQGAVVASVVAETTYAPVAPKLCVISEKTKRPLLAVSSLHMPQTETAASDVTQ